MPHVQHAIICLHLSLEEDATRIILELRNDCFKVCDKLLDKLIDFDTVIIDKRTVP